jgi:hypothetical protein
MSKPFIRYLVSSPHGDIPADESKWDLPLEGDELRTPYRIYFHTIRDFLSKDEFSPFLSSISQQHGKEIRLNEVDEIVIRTEKHGLLYHPASIELMLKGDKLKLGLNVAVTDVGRHWLKVEWDVLQKLRSKYDYPYLPKAHMFSNFYGMSFLLEDWFEGYHEFHISKDQNGTHRLKLWDFYQGYQYLTSEQSFEIYKQTSKILTLYYDPDDFSEIFPWHHAAGDFVVKIEDQIISHPHPSPPPSRGRELICFTDKYPPSTGGRGLGGGGIDVRLTTARRYEPFIGFADRNTLNPLLSLCYYLLNLTIRMRLDKLDGLGEIVWIEDRCVEATLRGFFDALTLKVDFTNSIGNTEGFLTLLLSFSVNDLRTLVNPLLEQYRGTGDFSAVIPNLDKHIEELYVTLQSLPL